jgi:lipoprotein-anchoring transpeptidase ErfK/SrfK
VNLAVRVIPLGRFVPLVLLPLLLVATLADAATLPGDGKSYRDKVRRLLDEVQTAGGVQRHAEELKSLRETFAAAEEKERGGFPAEAERIYQLALLKGELLFDRVRNGTGGEVGAAAPPLPPAPGAVFPSVSSARQAPPAESADVVVESAPDNETDSGTVEVETVRSPRLVGGEGVYTVRKNDSLKLVASRLGVSLGELARMNRLKPTAVLHVGQKLRYNNRRIVPKTMDNGIVINIPERGLYLFKGGRLSAKYPVAVGMAKKKDKTIWRTPTGKFRVVDKKENPTWIVPPSIQKEMEENGEEVLEVVPPGPRNPLGRYAVKTSLGGILIHSTTRPTSINTFASHGCIRVMPEHMASLFRAVTLSMPGEIIYQPVKVAVTEEGRVFLEVNRDAYEQLADLREEVERLLRRHKVMDMVSWNLVQRVINDRKGIAEEITLQ